MRADGIAAAYLDVARGLDRLLPGTLDLPGDPAPAGSPPRPAELVREAGRLAAAAVDVLPRQRAAFLRGQLLACEQAGRRLAGQRVPLDQELAAVFGVRAGWGDEDAYRDAHRALAALLPGRGPLAARLAAHRDRSRVSPDRLLVAATALADALRTSVAARVPLPAGEAVTFRLVEDAPWAALHRYRGDGRSEVTLNAAAGLTVGGLARLVAHETYPGHHVQRCRAEAGPVARGRTEHRAVVANTPQALVAEGAAEIALRAAVGSAWGTWAQDVLAGVGVRLDGEAAQRVDAVTARLVRARQDGALLLHGGRGRESGTEAVVAHLRRWLLLDEARARRVLRFLRDPLWRLSTVAYVEGAALVGAWWDRDPSDARLVALLDGALTPADLRPNGGRATTGGVRDAMSGRPFC